MAKNTNSVQTAPRWTAAEDQVLVAEIKKNPTNIKKAMQNASAALGRSVAACMARWYAHVSKDKANVCFVTVSAKHKAMNRKNGKGVANSTSIWQKIVKILGL